MPEGPKAPQALGRASRLESRRAAGAGRGGVRPRAWAPQPQGQDMFIERATSIVLRRQPGKNGPSRKRDPSALEALGDLGVGHPFRHR